MILQLKLLILIAYFGNWFVWLGLIPQPVTWLQDIIPVTLFVHVCVKNRWNIDWRYGRIVLAVMCIICFSYVMNGSSALKAILFVRMLFRSYLMYLALINSDLSERSMRGIIRWICVLTAIQLPVAIAKMFVYGQGENAIGTYAFHGGGLSALMPLVVIAYAFSGWGLDKNKKRYIVVCCAAIAFAIIGGKRAFVFFLPVVLLGILFSLRLQFEQNKAMIAKAAILIILAALLVFKFIPTLNPEGEIGGSADIVYALEYAKYYETKETEDHMSMGRLPTAKKISKWLLNQGYARLLFGTGPGTFMQTFTDRDSKNLVRERLFVLYGTAGFFLHALQIGFLGSFIYTLLYVLIMKQLFLYSRRESDIYWKILSAGTGGFAFVYILLETTYGQYTSDDLTLVIFFILAAFVGLRENMVAKVTRPRVFVPRHRMVLHN